MAQTDIGAGLGGLPYVDPAASTTSGVYVSTPTPNAGVATNPTAGLVSAPSSSGKDTQTWYQDYLNSPEKKAADAATTRYETLANQKAALDKIWEQKDYDLARSLAASSGGGSYSAGLAEAAAIDKLNKEKAAHDLANQQEYTREALGSRGLGSSGQMAVDQGELKYNYDMLIKQIDLAAQARQAQAAQAAANAQRGVSAQLARLDAEHQKYLAYQPYNDAVLLSQIQDVRTSNEKAAIAQFKDLHFDPNTGEYKSADGTVSITVPQAQASIDVWNAANPTVAPYSYVNGSGSELTQFSGRAM